MTDDHWRTADLVAVTTPPRRMRAARRAGAATVAVATAVVVVVASSRDQTRCGQGCYGTPAQDRFGSLTYEPGHAWTRYAGSWQWSAQAGLAYLAVLATLVGVVAGLASRRGSGAAFTIAALAVAGWIAWVLLSPAAA